MLVLRFEGRLVFTLLEGRLVFTLLEGRLDEDADLTFEFLVLFELEELLLASAMSAKKLTERKLALMAKAIDFLIILLLITIHIIKCHNKDLLIKKKCYFLC